LIETNRPQDRRMVGQQQNSMNDVRLARVAMGALTSTRRPMRRERSVKEELNLALIEAPPLDLIDQILTANRTSKTLVEYREKASRG